MSEKYTVTVSKEQLRVIQNACEDYLRTRMGQFWNLTQDITNADVWSDDMTYLTQINMERVRAAEEVFGCAYRLLYGQQRKKTHEMMIAEELYTQIRHYLYEEQPDEKKSYWCTSSDEPLKLTDEPRIKIERKKK